jgi:hypothetical protein
MLLPFATARTSLTVLTIQRGECGDVYSNIPRPHVPDFKPHTRACTHKRGIGRMSALAVNRTRRDGGTDVNDPTRKSDIAFRCDAQEPASMSAVFSKVRSRHPRCHLAWLRADL